jgi:phage minor structural protein
LFIDIDYNKRPQKARLHLAKPNKQIISHISEKFKDSLDLKLGTINELSFSIPYKVEENGEMVENKHIDLIKERMLIRVTLSTYEGWYVVDSIEEDSDNSGIFNVNAFSIPYELKGKRISGLAEESTNATELLTTLLQDTVWKIGTVDALFNTMYRSFESGDDTNVLDCIVNASETFGALVIWDDKNRTVSFKDPTKNGKFKGMSVNYGRLINNVKRTRTTDEMVTRMYVYGNEDLTIHSVNPSGQGYIEDFSYFMYPFKRDASKNVIQSSYFMSDALCHALLDQQNLIAQNSSVIKDLTEAIATKRTTLITEQSKLDNYNLELENILDLLDIAKASEDSAGIATQTSAKQTKEQQIKDQATLTARLKLELGALEQQLADKQTEISNEANFTQALIDELNLYIIESTWRDDNYIDAQELYEDAVKKFAEIRQPKLVIDVTIENLLNIVEEQYYWDKLVLGDLIKVKYPQMNIEYMAKIIQITYDLENGQASLVIANTTDLLDDAEKLLQLLKTNSSASSMVQNNKYKWDKVNAISNEVSTLLTSEWDATKNKIIAGVNNSVEVGNRGIIIKNPDFPDEVVIMQSGVIALSMDGGETWKTAIKPDGIVAERLIGKVIAGQELLITNSRGTFTMDNNGARFEVGSFTIVSDSGNNLVDAWEGTRDFVDAYKDDNIITPYEKKMLKTEYDKIKDGYNANVAKLQAYYTNSGSDLQFVNDYHSAYEDLYDYLFVTKQGDFALLDSSNMGASTRVLGTEFDKKFRDYQTAQVELEKQVILKAKSTIADVQKEAQDNINEVMDDVVYKIELFSPNGTVFRNGVINTTITATVYRGKDDITSTIPNSGFIWTKRDRNGNLDTAWNTAHANVGRTITITKDDVYQKADFRCQVDIA